MPRSLQNKVAIVTGASRGIGAATARALASSGAAVVLVARDRDALSRVAGDIEAAGGQALVVPTDVSDPTAVEETVARAVEKYGRLDVAFNNAAGRHRPAPLAEVSVEDFDAALKISLRGVFLSMKHQIRAMVTGGGGSIVNMSSTAGMRGVRGIGAYTASKHGVIGLTKSAALDYAAAGIRINAVAPGPILTEAFAGVSEEQLRHIAGAVPLGRMGTPEEVAQAVVWLASDDAAFVTGNTFTIDGGKLAGGA